MQGGGAVGAGDGMSRAGGRAERGFEGGDSRSGGQPVAPQHLGHSGDVVILDVLPAVGKKLCRSGSHFSLSTIMVRRRSSSSQRSEEHTSELQSLMRISYAVFCLKKQINSIFLHSILHLLLSDINIDTI